MLDEYKVSDSFWPKLSTPLAMPKIGYIVIDSSTRHHMNFSMEGSQIFPIFGFLVASTIF
jgi:hypothetical protein